MTIMEPLIGEIDMETPATRQMLERVPADKLAWRPHEKSMTLGQLALHVAGTPGMVSQFLTMDEVPPPEFGDNPQPASKDEILSALEESVETAKGVLAGMSPSDAESIFRIVQDGQEVMAMPKAVLARAILLNHWYHHRGQLSVYLRLLDVSVPATYGASADENAMGA